MIIIHHVNQEDYRPRALSGELRAALKAHPVVVLTGARQTGKTTLALHLEGTGRRTFLSLDDIELLDLAKRHPADFLDRDERLTIDEVQRAPDLLLAIKRAVDRERKPGRFLLTGSANLLLMNEVADSLAGRAVYLHLGAMTAGEKAGRGTVGPWSALIACDDVAAVGREFAGHPTLATSWLDEALRGGLPVPALNDDAQERGRWFDGYLRSYIERDLRDVSQVASLADYRRLMGLAVHRIGQLINQTELGRDAGLPQSTAHRYLNLLETTFMIQRVPAYSANLSKRLIKTPKIYWLDTGLAAHLAGITAPARAKKSPLLGALAENLVLCSIVAWRESQHPRPEVSYFRTAGGSEVDFVIESGDRVLPIEIKTGKHVRIADLRHLEGFLDEHGAERAPFGVVLCDADEPKRLSQRIAALPLATFI
jgi:predicted AAA+ superfamily ATPase